MEKIVLDAWDYYMPPQDPRLDTWPLMQSIKPTLYIVFAYLIGVVWLGSKVMRWKEKPFQIRPLMVTYNACMVVCSAYICFEFCRSGWIGGGYSFGCQGVDPGDSIQSRRMIWACYLYFLSKIVELLDTLLFILRKKFNLVTFLHVFHHAFIPVTSWALVRYLPGGLTTFHSTINTFIHVWMYLYYALAAAGEKYQKYLWWKRYMTWMQMIQFTMVFIHITRIYFIPGCMYPRPFLILIGGSAVKFFILFGNYYRQTYFKSKSKAPVKKD